MSSLLWLVRDRWGRDITLDDDTWYNHIVLRHSILSGHDATVAKALINPHRVMHDAWHANGECFYRARTHPRHPDLFVKVCVAFDSAGFGTVVTAFLTPNIGQREVQRWP